MGVTEEKVKKTGIGDGVEGGEDGELGELYFGIATVVSSRLRGVVDV